MDLIAHSLRIVAALTLIAFAWLTDFAAAARVPLTLYLLLVFIPLSPLDHVATRRGMTSAGFRLLIAGGHAASVFVVAALAPSTRPAALLGYLILAVHFALLGGLRDGLFVTAFAVPLAITAEAIIPAAERLAAVNLAVFVVGMVFVSVVIDVLSRERREQTARLERLNEALALASSVSGLRDAADAVVRAAAHAVNARLAALLLVDEQGALRMEAHVIGAARVEASRRGPRRGDRDVDAALASQIAAADGPAHRALREREVVVVAPQDTDLPFDPAGGTLYSVPLHDADGAQGVLAVLLSDGGRRSDADRTVLKALAETAASTIRQARAYEMQEQAVARLGQAEQAKMAVLRTVSHELRTPLAAVKGFLGLMETNWETLSEEQRRDFVARAGERSRSLARLVERVVDFTRLESAIDFRSESVALAEVVDRTIRRNADVLAAVHVKVEIERHLAVLGDALGIERILDNLLDNAAKFSPPGGDVLIHAVVGTGTVRLTIDDEGPGVDAVDSERIYDLMVQGDHELPGTTGIGLGLAIARRYAELMGGRLTHDADSRVGASFVLELSRAADLSGGPTP